MARPSFLYEFLEGGAAIRITVVLESHTTVVGWQSSVAGQRMMRVGMKGKLGNIPDYSAVDPDELAMGIVDMAMNRSVL